MKSLIIIEENKKPGHNSRIMNQTRIDFIRDFFPASKTCDPYKSRQLIREIKDELINAGLYKASSAGWMNLQDETIIRYVLKVQGRKINRRNQGSKNRSLYLGE